MALTNSLSCLLLLATLTFVNKSYAADTVRLQSQQMSENKAAHHHALITRALEVTVDEFGPFEIETVELTMSNHRLHKSIVQGKIFNAAVVLANETWDETTLGVKVPIRLGLLSYRVLMIHKDEVKKFEKINTAEALSQMTAGLAKGWETAKIFKLNNFKMKQSSHFDGLLSMLTKKRFDYIPRGIYEVYDELSAHDRGDVSAKLAVEPHIALNIPTITRLYVSPTEPRIAKRLDAGLHKLLDTGELKDILYKYYEKDIRRADIPNRRVIKIENPYYSKGGSLDYESLLFSL